MSRKGKRPPKPPREAAVKPYSKRKRRDKQNAKPSLVKAADLPFALIILAYILIVTFTPNWMALDTNATKFLSLSLINLLAFGYLLVHPGIRKEPFSLMRFFNTRTGLVYSGFLLVSLLSFTQAINIQESVLHFAKLFSVFTAAFVLTAILIRDMRYVRMIVWVMTGLLVFDALSVFYNIGLFIQGEVGSISDIKTVYSNKNILASSIYVKLPFPLFLLMFGSGGTKNLAWAALAAGFLATLFMATRAFYLGLVLISLVFVAYAVMNYFRKREKAHLRMAAAYLGALALSVVVYSVVQSNFYPESGSRHTQALGERMASIREVDTSISNRFDAWQWSGRLISENPFLGVGSGNWKIAILEHENQKNPGYIYLYKAHNDFIENTAETGLAGGLLFLAIFLAAGWSFVRLYRRQEEDPDNLFTAAFLGAAGLGFYAVDAFFNFPADRPEILILFALFVAMGIASSWLHQKQVAAGSELAEAAALSDSASGASGLFSPSGPMAKLAGGLAIVLMVSASWLLYLNYDSSKLQRIIYQEIMSGSLRSTSDSFVGQFPAIPNISMWGESISTLKARYLLNEGRSREAIEKIANDRGNPYDARREFYLAQAYHQLEMPDSVLHYAEKAYALKPNYFTNIHLLVRTLEGENRDMEVGPILEGFFEENKTNSRAWLYATGYLMRQEEPQLAYETILEARDHLPRDSLIQNQYRFLHHHLFVEPHSELFNEGARLYSDRQFAQAIEVFDRYMELVPDDHNAYRLRAIAYYRVGEYQKSIDDIEYNFAIHEVNGSLLNLRGVNRRNLGDEEGACRDFEAAMRMGIESARTNYERFCAGGG